MIEKKLNRSEVLIIVFLQVIIVLTLYIAFKPDNDDPAFAEAAKEIEFFCKTNEMIEARIQKAKDLAKKDKYLEAAIIYTEVAAAKECYPWNKQKFLDHEPTLHEIIARRMFSFADDNSDKKVYEATYKQMLKWKYPKWEETDTKNISQSLKLLIETSERLDN
jgi:hypothetical protein